MESEKEPSRERPDLGSIDKRPRELQQLIKKLSKNPVVMGHWTPVPTGSCHQPLWNLSAHGPACKQLLENAHVF